jgi:hypothetical protein
MLVLPISFLFFSGRNLRRDGNSNYTFSSIF